MKNFVRLVVVLSLVFSAVLATAGAVWNLPPGYEAMTGVQKRDVLWRWAMDSRYTALPAAGLTAGDIMRGLWPPYLHRTFEHTSDLLPRDRRKVIHPYGAVALVRFEPVGDHPYTGLIKSGATGIARLSLAAVTDSAYSPGLGLKLFVDGASSVNIVANFSLDGQVIRDSAGNPVRDPKGKTVPDRNFFSNTLTTHLPHPCAALLKVGALAFRMAIRTMERGPVSELALPNAGLARVDRHGSIEQHPVETETLLFVPTAAVRGLIGNRSPMDFRLDLERVPAGATMYEVYAQNVTGETPVQVGRVVLESGLVASRFGDEGLFFQHQRLVEPPAPAGTAPQGYLSRL